jgi:hypothetical protein
MSAAPDSSRARHRIAFALLAALLFGSFALRFAAADNALWCDEVVSILHAARLKRAWDVFQLHHDNNHPLNTLALHLLPSAGGGSSRRIVSVIASCLTVLVAARVAWRHAQLLSGDRRRACWAAVAGAAATGLCYPLVLFGTEARGYGMAMLFAATAVLAILECEHASTPRAGASARTPEPPAPGWVPILGWNISACLALAAHLTAIFVLLAGGVWSVVFAWKRLESWGRRLGFLAAWNLLPAVATLGIYVVFASQIAIAGGPQWSYAAVLDELAGLATGLPYRRGLWFGVPILVACLAGGLAPHLRRNSNTRAAWPALAAFFGVGIVLAPTLVLAIQPPPYLHARYFLLPLSLLILLLPAGLPQRTTPVPLRGVLALIAMLAVAGNARELADLIRHGRGEYLRCLEAIDADARSRETPVVVGINSQFRIGSVTNFYLKQMGSLDRVRLVPIDQGVHDADWLIVDPTSPYFGAPAVASGALPGFERAHDCPAARGAGVPWRSFRRVTEAAAR